MIAGVDKRHTQCRGEEEGVLRKNYVLTGSVSKSIECSSGVTVGDQVLLLITTLSPCDTGQIILQHVSQFCRAVTRRDV